MPRKSPRRPKKSAKAARSSKAERCTHLSLVQKRACQEVIMRTLTAHASVSWAFGASKAISDALAGAPDLAQHWGHVEADLMSSASMIAQVTIPFYDEHPAYWTWIKEYDGLVSSLQKIADRAREHMRGQCSLVDVARAFDDLLIFHAVLRQREPIDLPTITLHLEKNERV